MNTDFFHYNKEKVIQALRYHFISRREIKILMILVNVFAMLSAGLFFFKKVSPFAFMLSSLLWFLMMLMFWFILPRMVYKKSNTFRDSFKATLDESFFKIENRQTSRQWDWKEFSSWIESPHFFHLYFDSRSFFLLPKEAFQEESVNEARKIFSKKISHRG